MLCLQLPLAVLPLVRFVSDSRLVGSWCVRGVPLVLPWRAVGCVLTLNGALLWQVAMAQ